MIRVKRQFNFFMKAFVSCLTITIVCTIFLAGLLIGNYSRFFYDVLYRFSDNLLVQSNYSITYINDLAKRLSQSLFSDTNVTVFLNQNSRDNMNAVIANLTLTKYLAPLSYVDSVYLYNGKIDLLLSTKGGGQYAVNDFYDTEIAELLQDTNALAQLRGHPVAHHVRYANLPTEVCSYILYETNSYSDVQSALVINIRADTLTQSLQTMNSYNKDVKFFVLDDKGELLGSSPFKTEDSTTLAVKALAGLEGENQGIRQRTILIDETRYQMYSNSSNENGWTIFGLLPNSLMLHEMITATVISVFAVVVVFLACTFFCLFLAKRLNKPVQAITRLARGDEPSKSESIGLKTEEFRFLAEMIGSMQEQSRQFDRFKTEASPSIKQDFLSNLISGNTIFTMERNLNQLAMLNISYIGAHTLCMCVFQIDRYQEFIKNNNEKERWALRYAVINIVVEMLSASMVCEMFRKDFDKFVVLIDCQEISDPDGFVKNLETMLHEILRLVDTNLGFSMTIAYGPFFQGLEHLSPMYEKLLRLLQMRVKYGGHCVLNPLMGDQTANDEFEIPTEIEKMMIEHVLTGNRLEAFQLFGQISEALFDCSCTEITTQLIQLAYHIYHSVQIKNPLLHEACMTIIKKFMEELPNCETASDYNNQFQTLISDTCLSISKLKNTPSQANTSLIINRILAIVERDYSHKDLCLNSIAEQLDLSSNYIGHLFKSEENKSVAKYISDYRMERLAEYLKTSDIPLSKIIDMVGLEKNNYFYTCFKKYFGMSLGQYRLTLPMDSNKRAEGDKEENL